MPSGFKYLLEGGRDGGAVFVGDGFVPLGANPLVGSGVVEGGPVKAGVVGGPVVQEGFDGVRVGFGDFPGQAPALGVLVEAVGQALLVAVAELDRADIGAAVLLGAVGWRDGGEGGH